MYNTWDTYTYIDFRSKVMPSIMAKVLYPTGFAELKAISKLIHQRKVDWTVIRIVNPI
ncbi:hypothetical protein ACQKNX_06725 [Lysinibacillus sp. NPDC093712]|uniref:hypothetical protein n=1 Tax=Lysinibacillus sp. NPDC093712 TaxID=3390579 RepID=UPI003CFF00D9